MKTDDLADRLLTSALGALDTWSVSLGDCLGLYEPLRKGWLTAADLAAMTEIHPRYAREWLEQQTVSGLIEVDDPRLDPQERRYRLPEEHADVLTNRDALTYLAPLMRSLGAAGAQLPALEQAYRTGGGVAWAAYGPQMRTGQADTNRPWFLTALGSEWFPSVAPLHTALASGARVADVGCGDGWSAIGMALAYPGVTVDGFDLDGASVVAARHHAEAHDVTDRVTFRQADVAAAAGADQPDADQPDDDQQYDGRYDVVTAFECIHDLADPIAVLDRMRRMARPGGFVLVMDERVPERFTGPSDDLVERLMYGFSLMICLPDGMSHRRSAATGTVMRPATLRRYAAEAGFTGVEVLPIEHDLWRFYRLVLPPLDGQSC